MTPPTGAPRFPESVHLSDDGRRMRDQIVAASALFRDHAREGEVLGTLAPETLQKLHEIGVFRITIPRDLGGFALGAVDTAQIVRELGQFDASAGWAVIVSSAARNALIFDPRARIEVFEDLDSWPGPIMFGATVFAPKVGDGRKVDGGWMVKGKWSFGSSCKSAKWGSVGFEYDDPHTGARRRAMGILSRDQYTIVDDWNVMGLQATSSNSVRADEEVFIPEYRAVHTADIPRLTDGLRGAYEGIAFRHSSIGSMIATTVAFASLALGMADGALGEFLAQASKRPPFNLPYKTMSEMSSIHVVAGKARAVINSAAAVISGHADETDRRAIAGEDFGPWEEPEVTMDLVHQIHECLRMIDGLQLALGSSTVSLSNPIQRYVRDIHVLATHGAFRVDPMAEINGRDLFGLPPFQMMAALSSPAPDAQGGPPPGAPMTLGAAPAGAPVPGGLPPGPAPETTRTRP